MCASSSARRAASPSEAVLSRSSRKAPAATARPATNPIAIPFSSAMRLLRSGKGIVLYADILAGPVGIPGEQQGAVVLDGVNHLEQRGIGCRARPDGAGNVSCSAVAIGAVGRAPDELVC